MIQSTVLALLVKAKIAQEFKEKTAPNMLGTLQKNVNNAHINGSEVAMFDISNNIIYLLSKEYM